MLDRDIPFHKNPLSRFRRRLGRHLHLERRLDLEPFLRLKFLIISTAELGRLQIIKVGFICLHLVRLSIRTRSQNKGEGGTGDSGEEAESVILHTLRVSKESKEQHHGLTS